MKKLIIGLVVATIAFYASSATLEENINNGNYAAAITQINLSTNTLSYVKTATQAAACYDAAVAATNYSAAATAAHIALWYGDKATFERFLDLCATPAAMNACKAGSKNKLVSWLDMYGQGHFDQNATGHGKILLLNKNDQQYLQRQSLNWLYPDMMLAWYKKLAAAGNWNLLANIAVQANFFVDANNKLTIRKFATWLSPEWKALIDSFTAERIATVYNANLIECLLQYATTKDTLANDIERTETHRWMTEAVIKQYAKQISSSTCGIPVILSTRTMFAQTMIEYCQNIFQKIYWAKALDGWNSTKDNSKQLFPLVLASDKLNWNQKAEYALWIDDKDLIIDVFLTIGLDADAKNIAAAIPVFNGLDVGYRSNDVKKILATINKKYTLKLYNDRDTWEPILSKVRALLEVID